VRSNSDHIAELESRVAKLSGAVNHLAANLSVNDADLRAQLEANNKEHETSLDSARRRKAERDEAEANQFRQLQDDLERARSQQQQGGGGSDGLEVAQEALREAKAARALAGANESGLKRQGELLDAHDTHIQRLLKQLRLLGAQLNSLASSGDGSAVMVEGLGGIDSERAVEMEANMNELDGKVQSVAKQIASLLQELQALQKQVRLVVRAVNTPSYQMVELDESGKEQGEQLADHQTQLNTLHEILSQLRQVGMARDPQRSLTSFLAGVGRQRRRPKIH
jgi:chromosome segregation ATPase